MWRGTGGRKGGSQELQELKQDWKRRRDCWIQCRGIQCRERQLHFSQQEGGQEEEEEAHAAQ